MEVIKTVASHEGSAETPAARNSVNTNREEEIHLVNKKTHNEVDDLNHKRRSSTDADHLKTRRKILKIGTWNVRTLAQPGKFENLVKEVERMNIDIMGICETRWKESGSYSTGEYQFFFSGGDHHTNGTGLLLKKTVARSVIGFWPLSDRVMMIKIQATPFNINLIQTYMPTSEHQDEEVECIYEEIEKCLKYTKKNEIVLVQGDFNAKVGNNSMSKWVGKYALGVQNERGEQLIDFAEKHQMVITNTWYQHPKRNIYTWKSPGDCHRNQIDYILINNRFRNVIKDAKTLPGADINSDHNPVVIKAQVKLKRPTKAKVKEQLNTDMLQKEEFKTKYAVEVDNIYEILTTEDTFQVNEEETDREWNKIQKAMQDAASNILPKKERQTKNQWMTDEILDKMNLRRNLKNSDKEKYYKINKEIEKMCKDAKSEWWDQNCKEIEELDAQNRSKELHRKIKSITGKKKRSNASKCIENKNGEMLFEDEEIVNRWVEYIQELYDDQRGEPPEVAVDEEDQLPFLPEELENAIKHMKNGKAPGTDKIRTEMIKSLSEKGKEHLLKLLNHIYTSGNIPKTMNESIFERLPKKPKTTKCTEYRTLSLMSHILKLLLIMILRRIRPSIEQNISLTQSGFMMGKGTREGLFNIRTIMERYLDLNKDIYICFIDYEKAFDRVNHQKMIESMLTTTTIDPKIIKIITNLYWSQEAFVRTEDGLSKPIYIRRGVRQGCILSPTLFNLYTEIIFKSIEEAKGVSIGGVNINNLRYADDTALIAENEKDLQRLLDLVNEKGKIYGMKMNAKKTKTMLVSKSKQEFPSIKIVIDNVNIEEVKEFKYLGQTITSDGSCKREVITRIAIAKQAFNSIQGVLTSRKISLERRFRILKCYVTSVLTYGAETWTITKYLEKRLKAFEIWCMRRILKISWKERKTNKEVLKLAKQKRTLLTDIMKRKNRFFGHTIRHNNFQTTLLEGKINGKRGRGRPRKAWVDDIMAWQGRPYQTCKEDANDRDYWRFMTSNLLWEDGTE